MIENCPCAITYLTYIGQSFTLEGFLDTSTQATVERSNVRGGVVVLEQRLNIVHAIAWMYRLVRSVAVSIGPAELLAPTDHVGKLIYFKYMLEEGTSKQRTELVLDSRLAFHLCSTMTEPEEIKKKLPLVSIKKIFYSDSMVPRRRTPIKSHLTDELTKDG